ncbi:MAG: phosphoribosylglycinamide formyltransferase [Ginsengibacter sp.]
MNSPQDIKVAVFASGAGSNTQKILHYFKNHSRIKIALIVCNRSKAGVLDIANKETIPTLLIEKSVFEETGYVPELQSFGIHFIVLAGFLWKIPPVLIQHYPENIINIHPALLPSFGGKGMYGMAVHQAVLEAKEKESGITIHFVDEIYDNGKIIFQAACPVELDDTPESLAQKIHHLEHTHYPVEIEKLVEKAFGSLGE